MKQKVRDCFAEGANHEFLQISENKVFTFLKSKGALHFTKSNVQRSLLCRAKQGNNQRSIIRKLQKVNLHLYKVKISKYLFEDTI